MSTKNSQDDVVLNYYDENKDDRTERHFGGEKFSRIQNSKVLVVGVGAVGNEVVKNLIMLGVRHLTIVDPDTVSNSNVNRCVFFREKDHNKVKKVDAVRIRAQKLRPGIRIVSHPCQIQDAPESVWDSDIVILGVDNDYSRFFVNAWLISNNRSIPVVNGAMGRDFVECEILLPGNTACLTCLWQESYFQEIISKEVRRSCDQYFFEILPKFPAISTFTSIVGGVMSAEVAKILAGDVNRSDLGYLIRLNLNKYEFTKGNVMRNPKCVEKMCRAGFTYYRDQTRHSESR